METIDRALDRASLGSRFFATLLDYLVIGCFFWVYVYSYGEPNDNGGYTVHGLKALIPVVFWFIYLIGVESLLSATLGHFFLGLKVVKRDNRRIEFNDSLKRHIVDPFDFFFFGVPAMICIKNTDLNQRLGDLWAKTIVVKDNEK
jgi:uncharacterized RDD family membrane protein YckC